MIPDGATEADTERDGLLSYAKEWHALIIGLGIGITLGLAGIALTTSVALGLLGLDKARQKLGRKAVINLKAEPWYGIGGSIIGTATTKLLGIDPTTITSVL